VGNEFGALDTHTGIVTPLFTGVSPHGVVFVASPEPASVFLASGALLMIALVVSRSRRSYFVATECLFMVADQCIA
jgi:hypothetical protein